MLELNLKPSKLCPLSQENAAAFASSLAKFDSSVLLQDGNRTINGKSLLGILSLGFIESQELKIIVDGADEKAAADFLQAFFANLAD